MTVIRRSPAVQCFCSPLAFILNRNSQCWDRVLLWYWKMKRPTKKSRTSRSCWGEKTRSYCTKIIKRWWTSLEVGFCSGFLREASIQIRHTKELGNISEWNRIERLLFILSMKWGPVCMSIRLSPSKIFCFVWNWYLNLCFKCWRKN